MATSIHLARTDSFPVEPQTEYADSLHLNSTPSFSPSLHPLNSYRPSSAKRRILLVDDDEEIRSLVRAFLQSEGYEVFSCGDGHRASELFRTRDDIDLLLTDLHMPGISGLVLADQLTALHPSLPVVVMSGMLLTEELQGVIAGNGWRFLPKPFQVPELLDTVHGLLANRSLSA